MVNNFSLDLLIFFIISGVSNPRIEVKLYGQAWGI